MRRLLAPAFALALITLGSVASAEALTIRGTAGPDRLTGTPAPDVIFGREGDDRLFGREGSDLLHGGPGSDAIAGEAGDDRVVAHSEGSDGVRCGAGADIASVDGSDRVAADCEVVSRQLSRDSFKAFRAQHQTQVEPDSFSFGSTIVSVFQSGRFVDGGAARIGWATSTNAGRTWRTGFLPAVSVYSSPAGEAEFITDPAVAYDAVHRFWLVSTLAVSRSADALLVSRSRNGTSWNRPVTAAAAISRDAAYDKEWIACDNGRSSRFRGTCYLAYLNTRARRLEVRRSTDGGLTWSEPSEAATDGPSRYLNGAMPVVRPDGALVVLFFVQGFASVEAIEAVRSTDRGVTFTAPRYVSTVVEGGVRAMRAPPFPSAEVDEAGTIYAAWHDCQLRVDCSTTDIVLSTSRDGTSWTEPRRVPTGKEFDVDYFVPGLAVDSTTSGKAARVAIAYHSLRQCGAIICAGVDVNLITSADGGGSWSVPQRLNAESMPLLWIADTGLGRMTGDYISTSFVGGRPLPVFSLASAPVGAEFRQSIFATTRGAPRPPGETR